MNGSEGCSAPQLTGGRSNLEHSNWKICGVVACHVGRTTQKNKQAAQIHIQKQVSHAVTSRAAQILE